jgi:hypothetical protein
VLIYLIVPSRFRLKAGMAEFLQLPIPDLTLTIRRRHRENRPQPIPKNFCLRELSFGARKLALTMDLSLQVISKARLDNLRVLKLTSSGKVPSVESSDCAASQSLEPLNW